MREHRADHPLRESLTAVLRIDDDVAEIGIRREIGDRAREADESVAGENAEAHGAAHRARELLARHVARPERGAQEGERLVERDLLAIRRKDVLAATRLERLVVEPRDHFRVMAK